MDLLDFERADLYFEEETDPEVARLLNIASYSYGTSAAEEALASAQKIAPQSLTVLVAMFRYCYYQHHLSRAREAGMVAAEIAAARLGFDTIRYPSVDVFGRAFRTDPGLARFYLQSLKGVAYLNLRLGDLDAARLTLSHLITLDPVDRLGCRLLLEHVPAPESGGDAMLRQVSEKGTSA